jgi:hypothetical protein
MEDMELRNLIAASLRPHEGKPLDPRLLYGLVVPAEAARRVSIFQEFSEASIMQRHAFEAIVRLPPTFLEPVTEWPRVLSSRAIGLSGWRIIKLTVPMLDVVEPSESMPVWTLFTHEEEGETAVERLRARTRYPPLHVSLRGVEAATPLGSMDLDRLKRHVIELAESSGLPGLSAMRPVVERWAPRPARSAPVRQLGHFALLPNQMVLHSLGYEFDEQVPDWTSREVADFAGELEKSAGVIDGIRGEAEAGSEIRFLPPRPDLWLIAPAVSPGVKARIDLSPHQKADRRAAEEFLRRLERQQSYDRDVSDQERERFAQSELAQDMASTRKGETGLFAAAIGTRTAGNIATTLRMPPAINQVAGRVGALAENIRSGSRTPPEKLARMFGGIQELMEAAVGQGFVDRIRRAAYGVKVVSDAPIEWLPVDGLPLSLSTDVSRIPSTPGEMILLQLLEHESLRLAVSDFASILVVSAFEPSDRLAQMMRIALDTTAPAWSGRLNVRFEIVTSERELIEILNSYDGPLMVFDGHGAHPRDRPGHLKVGASEVEVFSLRGRARVPPIVVLSACDTHAAGRNAMTTANAFLVLGARTVLATMLPIGGPSGAMFAARLLLRIADYLPRAARVYGRVVRWSEIAGGMLRMQFLSDLLHPRGGPDDWLDEAAWFEVGPRAGFLAARGGDEWIRWVGKELQDRGVADEERLRRRIRRAVPMSDTIRYAQLGNPETILIGDLADLSDEAKAEFAGFEEALRPVWKSPPEPKRIEPGALLGLLGGEPVARRLRRETFLRGVGLDRSGLLG